MTREHAALPALLVGARRSLFARLVGTGLAQAGLVGVTAVAMPVLLASPDAVRRGAAAAVLLAGALALGLVRSRERVLGERLGQHYVQEIRVGLVASSLVDDRSSLGITVARTTNDLTSVRNWIALGITPIAVGVPLIAGTLVALAMLSPMLAVAVAVPMAVLAVVLLLLARVSYDRSRRLRRQRGRLAAHVSDTVHAAGSIRAGGGQRRELRQVERRGHQVMEAAVERARVAGHIRGAAVAAAAVAAVAVAMVGAWSALPGGTIATALTVVGVLAGPVTDLGRVVEYRQSYRAARRILAPVLVAGSVLRQPLPRGTAGGDPETSTLEVRGLVVRGASLPDLDVGPGATVLVRSADPVRVETAMRALAGLDAGSGHVRVAGRSLADVSSDERRALVGHAARDLPLERGTLARAVRYRRPDSTEPIGAVLATVGLVERVARLPDQERTTLRRGGEPLSPAERAQVRLARALYGAPPLLVVDHLDAQLGRGRVEVLRESLRAHEGVAVVASDHPEAFLDDVVIWDLDSGSGEPGSHLVQVRDDRGLVGVGDAPDQVGDPGVGPERDVVGRGPGDDQQVDLG